MARMVHDGPTSGADTLEVGLLGHLRDFTAPDLSSIHPASTPGSPALPGSTKPSPGPLPTRTSCCLCSTGQTSRCTPTARRTTSAASSPNAGSPAIRSRQAGAGYLPQPAENLLQARHLVLGLPRCPAKDPGRRPRA